jgi:hypothetical protein
VGHCKFGQSKRAYLSNNVKEKLAYIYKFKKKKKKEKKRKRIKFFPFDQYLNLRLEVIGKQPNSRVNNIIYIYIYI